MASRASKVAIAGLGKIARDQHVPALAASDAFELIAVASPHSRLDGVPCYASLQALLQAVPEVSAIAVCTTPQTRFGTARLALEQGRHVLLEKPPGISVSEVQQLVEHARRQGVTLFASWHSRHARAVEPARAWLAGRRVKSVQVQWKEDVRVWHPGQDWIWKAGGLGVFDPGINALSILTHILPGGLRLEDAQLSCPANCETPIAARLLLADPAGASVTVELDFLHTGAPCWDMAIDAEGGRLDLLRGGSVLELDARPVATPPGDEYPNLYAHFARLVRGREIDVDLAPLQLVADAFLCGRRTEVEPFTE